MINKDKILIIDDCSMRTQQARVLLKFINYEADCISVCDIEKYANHFCKYLAVIISETLLSHVEKKYQEILLSKLKGTQHACRFILYHEHDHEIDKNLLKLFIGHLKWPFNQNLLLSLLHIANISTEHFKNASDNKTTTLLASNFVGNTHKIIHVRKLIAQVAKTKATVLITGESGTGKEIAAKLIHELSDKKKGAFVPVNCAAIPSELLESELFGHEKGAFTSAINSRQGRFEIAKGGTLFLDEIGDMPLNMQVKLLRVLQEKTFERVGSNRSIVADVRIIAATNTNLQENIKIGKFREDLFYRLNVFPIELPPLRERVDDIPLLISNFLNQETNISKDSIRLLDEAKAVLAQYHWPGNVRELYNLIERLIILYPNAVVSKKDLPNQFQDIKGFISAINQQTNENNLELTKIQSELPNGNIDLKQYLYEIEESFISQALLDCNWVVAHAAERLTMRRTTLVEKMRKFGLSRNQDKTSQIIDEI